MKLYPFEGDRKDGTTYLLKGKRNACKKSYMGYLKTAAMTHDEVMTAFKVELNERVITGNPYFQQGLVNRIDDKTLEQYKGRSVTLPEMGYGETLV